MHSGCRAWLGKAGIKMAKRVDATQALIVRDLRKAGAFVQSLASIGKGCPDLLVLYRGDAFVMEIKDGNQPPSKQRLTPLEKEWHAQALDAHYRVYIVKTSIEALQIIGATAAPRAPRRRFYCSHFKSEAVWCPVGICDKEDKGKS